MEVPTVNTAVVSAFTQTTATCGGSVTSDGGGAVTARGVCWSSASAAPTIANDKTIDGAGTGSFTSSLTGLTAGTQYYVRAYAANSAGTGYGDVDSFTTAATSGTVTDVDGNVYQTITIGTQVWMAENLKVNHYRNGDTIPAVTDNMAWWVLSTGACCEYGNSTTNGTVYGWLYNWFAIDDGRNIAPEGWHVPSDAEWQTLADYLGGDAAAGGKMKEAGTTHWNSPNTGATNQCGFAALPGGSRGHDGTFWELGNRANFWSTTAYDGTLAWDRTLGYDVSDIYRYESYKLRGYSVRCIKD